MIFSTTGRVSPVLHVLGSAHVPTYLIEAPRPVIVDAGFSCLGPGYVKAIREVLGSRPPEILFLTHSHFDHCGAAAFLKKAFPGLKVAASRRAAEILARPRALELIRDLNRESLAEARTRGLTPLDQDDFQPFEVELTLDNGQELDLGEGMSLRALATPGHTRDFLSYHLPGPGILIASEAVGCAAANGYVIPECLSDYEAYLSSLRFLAGLPVQILAQGHLFVYTAEAVPDHFRRSIAAAEGFKAMVEELWAEEGGRLEAVMGRVKAVEYDPQTPPRQIEKAYLINLEARVRQAAKSLLEA